MDGQVTTLSVRLERNPVSRLQFRSQWDPRKDFSRWDMSDDDNEKPIKPKHAGGRPRKPLDENLIKKLAGVGCSNESIAIQAECSVDTLTRRCADLLKKSREGLKTNLRIWQLEAARKGNVSMLIWLGKQILQQSDTPIHDSPHETYSPIESLVKND